MSLHPDLSRIFKRIETLEEDTAELKSTRPFLMDMVERNTAAYENLSKTLSDIELSIVKMDGDIKSQEEHFSGMNQKLDEYKESNTAKMSDFEKRISSIESKTTFDIAQFIKDKFPWIVILAGGGIAADRFLSFRILFNCNTLSILAGINFCPPNPGFTVITKTISTCSK